MVYFTADKYGIFHLASLSHPHFRPLPRSNMIDDLHCFANYSISGIIIIITTITTTTTIIIIVVVVVVICF